MAEQYTLPELPYDYSALEPHISARIMELHHDKHHATYVGAPILPLSSWPKPANPATSPRAEADPDLALNLGGQSTTRSSTTCPRTVETSLSVNSPCHRRPVRFVRQVPRALHHRSHHDPGSAAASCRPARRNLFIEQRLTSSLISSSRHRFCNSTWGHAFYSITRTRYVKACGTS